MENLDNVEYIELSDGDETIKLLLLDTFGIEDQDYAALLDEDNDQLYILEIHLEDNEVVFEAIEDEEEFNEILALYEELIDEIDEE